MRAGPLNRRVKIQSQSTTKLDAFHQPLPAAWDTIYECWASISNITGKLIYATANLVSQSSHEIKMRWTSSVVITAKQRVLYIEPTTSVTHTYEIEAVLNDKQANEQLTLLVYELSGQE